MPWAAAGIAAADTAAAGSPVGGPGCTGAAGGTVAAAEAS